MVTKAERRIKAWVKRHTDKHLCSCGCGYSIEILDSHYYSGIPKFVRGHNFQGEFNPQTGNKKVEEPSYWESLDEEDRNRRLSQLKKFRSGPEHPNWAGGVHITEAGYRLVRCVGHPCAKDGYVPEHRLVVEAWIKDHCPDCGFLEVVGDTPVLRRDAVVHHRNLAKTCNDIGNLVLMRNQSIHLSWHMRDVEEKTKFDEYSTDIFCPWLNKEQDDS